MERYIIKNNAPVSPPACGVTKEGRIISNFARRVQSDARFAAENGYYPLAEIAPTEELLEESEIGGEGKYVLKDGEWVFERK